MEQLHSLRPVKYRSVWLSDIHLGYRGCKAEYLIDFLDAIQCEYLFLVGDIFDLWYMRRKGLYWPQSHNNVIRKILGKAKHNTKVIYIPGNHDEDFRELAGTSFGNIQIHEKYLHTTADNKKLLLLHGDEFDNVIRCTRLVAFLGDVAYDILLYLNRWLNILRRKLGFPYWSLAVFIKQKIKNAQKAIRAFEQAAAHEARRVGADGVVCGHIHHAEIRTIDGILYCNDGDWVENCTAMIEHQDGSLELLHWSDVIKPIKHQPSQLAESGLPDRKIA